MTGPRVFTVPADVPFLPSLARAILAGGFPTPDSPPPGALELASWTVLLPTRRAAAALTAAFLEAGGGRALILPRIRPLGDVDEDEFAFAPLEEGEYPFAVPPAIPATQLLFLLARLIDEWLTANAGGELARTLTGHPGQLFDLARSLIALIDSFDTEEIGLDSLGNLLGPDFAAHRQAMLDFLRIVRTRLPQELEEAGLTGQARRRSLLLREEARRLASGPYSRPIIAAGSTGTIPATAGLLKVIAGLPRGAVVLPGLDQVMDEESWQETLAEESHPQHGLGRLLREIGIAREDVTVLPGIAQQRPGLARLWLASELMRPAATTDSWREALARSRDTLPRALEGVELIEAPDETREALAAALILRSVLERPGATGGLVTPDRRLARRVKSELRRWGIEVADSAGEPAARTPAGIFLRLIAEWGTTRSGARELAALIKHPLFCLGRTRTAAASLAEKLEIALLRGIASAAGPGGLARLCARRRAESAAGENQSYLHPAVKRLAADDWAQMAQFIADFTTAASAFAALTDSNEPRPLSQYLRAHVALAEALAAAPGEGNALWRGRSGEVLAELFGDLLQHADNSPLLGPGDYLALLSDELEARPVRLSHTGHPRLTILGLLEARLIKPDVVILAGLNRGVWPPEPRIDPWLSRPMKEVIGLAQAERRIGLSAHDFIQNFAAGEIYLTSARKIDGEPSVPSRFLLRLGALVAAEGRGFDRRSRRWRDWAVRIDSRLAPASIGPALPTPGVHLRPKSWSVSRVVKLIENPYRVFAENILGLRELDAIGKPLGAAERGTAIHEALRRFCEQAGKCAGADGRARFLDCCREAFARFDTGPSMLPLWWPRCERMAEWFVERERELRQTAARHHFEVAGSAAVALDGEEFTLTARADRIDVLRNGSLRIIDYKTGKLPSYLEVARGSNPQLALEAWLAMKGAFAGVEAREVSELVYVRLAGGIAAGELRPAHNGAGAAQLAEQASAGLVRLLSDYHRPGTPYLALADPATGGRGSVGHLARADEWQLNR